MESSTDGPNFQKRLPQTERALRRAEGQGEHQQSGSEHNSQEHLILSERDENLETKEKILSFTGKLDLGEEDLAYLLGEVPPNYQIENVDLSLRLNPKLRTDQMPSFRLKV